MSVFFFSSTNSDVLCSTISSRLLAYFSIMFSMLSTMFSFLYIHQTELHLLLKREIQLYPPMKRTQGGCQLVTHFPLLKPRSMFLTCVILGLFVGLSLQHSVIRETTSGGMSLHSVQLERTLGRYGGWLPAITLSTSSELCYT